MSTRGKARKLSAVRSIAPEIVKELIEELGDMDIVEATEPLKLMPDIEDLRCAVPLNCRYCFWAQCVKRMYKSAFVSIGKSRAYVLAYDAHEQPILMRYVVPKRTKEIIEKFDAERYKDIEAQLRRLRHASYELSPPHPSATRAREQQREAARGPQRAHGHAGGGSRKRKPRRSMLTTGAMTPRIT